MKSIHFSTLLMHLGLTVFAAVTINHYHDAFLLVSLLILLGHAIWFARSKDNMLPAHLFGAALQLSLFALDVIDVHSGAFGLGGGEFARFFYEIGLIISCIIEVVILLMKPKKHSKMTDPL